MAPTPLAPGDVAIVGFRSGAPDGLAFVTFTDLDVGTMLGFTDASYQQPNTPGSWRGSENFAVWTAPSFIPAGTVVVLSFPNSPSPATSDVGTISGALNGLSGGGDQIFVYQRSDGTVSTSSPFTSTATATTWDAANGGSLLFGINLASTGGFITSGTTNLNSTNTSYVPDAGSGAGSLTLGATALNITNSGIVANAQYNGPRSGLSIGDFKNQVFDQNNWVAVDATSGTLDSTDFTVASSLPSVDLSVSSSTGTEAGQTIITVTATASSPVSGDQTVSLGASGTNITVDDYSLSNATITILDGQTTGSITFTVQDDALIEGTETVVLEISNPSSGIVLGNAIAQPITITDNDFAPAGITITPSGNGTTVTEGGATDTYSVVLNSQPIAEVTVTLNAGTQLTASASVLTFTPDNWNVAQDVTVTAVDDAVFEGSHSGSITHTATSTDASYNGITVPTIAVAISDNDVTIGAAPTIQETTATPFLNLATTGSGAVSGVIGDPTDPVKTLGIDFAIADPDTPLENLTVTVSSSNPSVVPNGNLALTGTAGTYNLKIDPDGVGFATITVSVSDGSSIVNYTINYAASAASGTPSTTRFHTGTSDASTAIALDSQYMLVADDEDQTIRLYDRTNSGLPITSFDFTSSLGLVGSGEVDLEASTRIGNTLYWMGSHANNSSAQDAPNRERIFATQLTGTGASSTLAFQGYYQFLEDDLIAWDANNGHGLGANFLGLSASAASGISPEQANGFNMEGLTVAPDGQTVYVSFRAPQEPTSGRTDALIVPVTNFTSLFTGSGGTAGSALFGAPILLELGGRGIRSIERNGTGQYVIIAGPPGAATTTAPNDFRLYTWTGNPADAPVLRTADLTALNANGSFESIVAIPDNLTSSSEIQVLVDNGDTIWYNNGTASKDLSQDNFQKFRSEVVTLGDAIQTGVTVSIAATDTTAAEAGTDPGTFRISRTGDTSSALTVTYAVATGNGQATSEDYTPALTGTVEIPVGASFVDVAITPIDDTAIEGLETVTLTLVDTANYDLGAGTSATVTLADNDTAPPKLAPGDVIFNEYASDNDASGNDFFELLVLKDGADLRGLRVSDNELVGGIFNNNESVFVFGNDSFLSNVPKGTTIAVYTLATGVATDTVINPMAEDWSMVLAPGTGVTPGIDGLGGSLNTGLSTGGEGLYLYLPGVDGTSAGTDNLYLDYISFEADGAEAPAGLTDLNLPSVADNAYYTGNTAADNNVTANWTTYDGAPNASTTPGNANPGQDLSNLRESKIVINEILASHTGIDTTEFIELFGAPGAPLAGLSLIIVESDVSGLGTIDRRIDFGAGDVLGENGFFLIGNPTGLAVNYGVTPNLAIANDYLENSSLTAALVKTSSLSGTSVTGTEAVVDTVALTDGGAGDTFFFNAPVIGPDGTFLPAGARRVTDGVDTDTAADWVISDFNLGAANTPTPGLSVGVSITQSEGTTTVVEGGTTDTYTIVLNSQPSTDVTIAIAPDTQVTTSTTNLTFTPANWNVAQTVTVTAVDDVVNEGNHTGTITHTVSSADTAYNGISVPSVTVNVTDNDAPVTITKIHQIQGNASTQLVGGVHNDVSPLNGQSVTIEGVVVADFQLTNQLRGFFIQEETADQDGDSSTSEGIFVFTGNTAPLNVQEGQKVRVTGNVSEFFGMTQVTATTAGSITLIQDGNNLAEVPSTAIDLPVTGDVNDYYEQFEGMRVQFTDKLVVSEYFELARYGQIVLTEGDRPFQYSHLDDTPTAVEYAAFLDTLNRSRIILDDDDNIQNSPLTDGVGDLFYPQPGGLSTGTQGPNYFRGGDSIIGLTGVLHWSFAGQTGTDAWRIRPTEANPISFTVENPRPTTPPTVGGNVKVASFNVLNYFDAPFGVSQNRGADSADEFERQNAKLIEALKGINADVFGLVEIENNGTAVQELVNRLNAEVGAGTYDYIETGVVGTDQITVALIYKPSVVQPKGNVAILDAAAFTDPLTTGQQRNRPAIAQAFEVIDPNNPDFGAAFNVAVNHLKSKGADGAVGADLDQNDGQGAWNATREAAADYLVNTWIPSDPTGQGDADWLIIGDLNAYKGEDPITTIKNAGYTDLVEQFGGSDAYSYVFNGQLGYLDYALANSALASQVTGVAEWHINADEVPVFDYNNTIQDGDEASFEAEPNGNPLYEVNPFRTSDHDPVIIGLNLTDPNQPPTAVTLLDTVTSLPENTNTTNRIRVANISITDDGRGTNALSLTGSDAGLFELDGIQLFLKANTTLNFEAQSSYAVTVNIDDTAVGNTPDVSTDFTLTVTDVNEAPIAVEDSASTTDLQPVVIAVLANDQDGDAGDTVAIASFTNPSNGSLIQNANNTFTYTPIPGFAGTDTFTYTIRDSGNLTATATVTLTVTQSSNQIVGTNGDDNLVGTNRVDVMRGLAGNDILNGGLAADHLIGGSGNDTYLADATDVIIEAVAEGTDTVQSSVSWSLLPANVENLSLTGAGAINGTGNELNNTLTGNSAANILYGGEGNDVLNGRAGADTLIGEQGNDLFIVDNLGDVTVEAPDQGTDTVQSSISWSLDDNIEILLLSGSSAINGTGNELSNTVTGNRAANTLSGAANDDILNGEGGNDTLNGGTGDDTLNGGGNNDILNGEDGNDTLNGGSGLNQLLGGAGDDTYRVSTTDLVIEADDSGNDLVIAATSWTLGSYVEDLSLTGSTNSQGIGNSLDNTLTGNSGNNLLDGRDGNDILRGGNGRDTLAGGTGNDILIGGSGNDTMVGDSGNDMFIYNSLSDGNDTITDFNTTEDALDVSTLLETLGYSGSDPVAEGFLRFTQSGANTLVQIDQNGTAGGTTFSTFVTLNQVLAINLILGQNVLI